MRILVLGVTGALGNALLKVLSADPRLEVWGTSRAQIEHETIPRISARNLISGIDALNNDALISAFTQARPEVVINCVGLIKQLSTADNPLYVLPINSMLPHRLADLCELNGSRLVHISTDCVYSGRKGMYRESDASDAEDLYGKSKYIGEIRDRENAITLRTSGIGHELKSSNSLLSWFLSQQDEVKGYVNAIYSGLPWIELARVINDFVLPSPELHGLYHVSSKPISKFELLKLIAEIYGKTIRIVADNAVKVDRSLDSTRFQSVTGYVAPEWPDLISKMHCSR
jgi:dTDP-4-dehydrorhamnose reductase